MAIYTGIPGKSFEMYYPPSSNTDITRNNSFNSIADVEAHFNDIPLFSFFFIGGDGDENYGTLYQKTYQRDGSIGYNKVFVFKGATPTKIKPEDIVLIESSNIEGNNSQSYTLQQFLNDIFTKLNAI